MVSKLVCRLCHGLQTWTTKLDQTVADSGPCNAVGEESGLCVAACRSLGDLGTLLFTIAALAWGAWNARMRRIANNDAAAARTEKDAAITQLAMSLRPVKITPSLQTLEGERPFPAMPPLPKNDTGREPG